MCRARGIVIVADPASAVQLLQIQYCNVEGVQWIDDVRFVIASDKAKKTQHYRCVAKEQRLSIFALPFAYEEEQVKKTPDDK